MILTAPYSEVSSAMTNLFYQSYSDISGTCSKKSLNVNDTWFGFYRHLKKGTFGLLYGNHRSKWVKIVLLHLKIWRWFGYWAIGVILSKTERKKGENEGNRIWRHAIFPIRSPIQVLTQLDAAWQSWPKRLHPRNPSPTPPFLWLWI